MPLVPRQVGDRTELAREGIRALEQAALPTGKEWRMWWNEVSRHMEMTYAWERAIRDAITRLVRNQLTLARQIRLESEAKRVIRYDSEGHVYGEESRTPEDITREALVWFITQIRPAANDAPEWAKFLFRAVEGCYLQQARLGIELAGIKRRGYLTLNHSATVKNPDAFKDNGIEEL